MTTSSTPDMVMDGHASHANKGENIKIELVRMLESSFSGASSRKIMSVVDKVLAELEAEESMKGILHRNQLTILEEEGDAMTLSDDSDAWLEAELFQESVWTSL